MQTLDLDLLLTLGLVFILLRQVIICLRSPIARRHDTTHSSAAYLVLGDWA